MSDRALFIQLNSGDFSVNQQMMDASGFRNTLSMPLVLSENKEYEVCVIDAFFPVHQTTQSVYISTNIVADSIVGSQMTSTILWIPFSELQVAGEYLYFTTQSARKWYNLSLKTIPYIDVNFTLSTGDYIPVQAGDYSSITIAIREKY